MPDSKADVETLMNEMLPLAKQLLTEVGEFYPFGGVTKSDGEIVYVAGQEEGNDMPRSKDVIGILREGFRQGADEGEYKATALVYDVRVRTSEHEEPSDAIAVALDHIDDYSIVVIFPYRFENKKLVFSETVAQEGEYHIFGIRSFD